MIYLWTKTTKLWKTGCLVYIKCTIHVHEKGIKGGVLSENVPACGIKKTKYKTCSHERALKLIWSLLRSILVQAKSRLDANQNTQEVKMWMLFIWTRQKSANFQHYFTAFTKETNRETYLTLQVGKQFTYIQITSDFFVIYLCLSVCHFVKGNNICRNVHWFSCPNRKHSV